MVSSAVESSTFGVDSRRIKSSFTIRSQKIEGLWIVMNAPLNCFEKSRTMKE